MNITVNATVAQSEHANFVGQPVLRREDARMLTGRGRFTDDIQLPGMTYAAVLRSSYGHARIRSIDASRATAMAGVVGVLTEADLAGKVGDIRPNWVVGNSIVPPHRPLASGRVRYLGEPVAFLVANTRAQAVDAVEAIDVDYEPLPVVVDQEAALQPGAPQLHDNVPGNLIGVFKLGGGDYAAAAASADRLVKVRLVNQRLIPNPMEPRAVCAYYDELEERLTIYMPSQVPHMSKRWLAETLGWPEHHLHLIAPQPSIIEEIIETLLALKKRWNMSLIVVEQNLEFITSLSDRILNIQKARITEELDRESLMVRDVAMSPT